MACIRRGGRPGGKSAQAAEKADRVDDPTYAWAARIAHHYRLPVSTVRAWPFPDLRAAVYSWTDETSRCQGCGLTPDDAWTVTAESFECPTCEDRDTVAAGFPEKPEHRRGLRARFRVLQSTDERMTTSSAVRFTRDGHEAKRRWLARRNVE